MGLIPMPHKVTVFKYKGLDDWGIPQFDEDNPVEYMARIKHTIYVRDEEGTFQTIKNDLDLRGSILFDGMATITLDDEMQFLDYKGRLKRIKPNRVKFTQDYDGKIILTRFTF